MVNYRVMTDAADLPARHDRQARFAPLGREGQRRVAAGRVTVVGCGALGSVAADLLARAGVGWLRLVDRDVLELSNLHRQALFTEDDVARALPKAVALAAHLQAVDGRVRVEAVVEDLDGANATELLRGCDVVIDGTDNFEARHVINEACLDLGVPWVHGACLGATAVAWPILPGRACFACLVPEAPAPGQAPTCETAGVLGSAVHVAAAIQVTETMKVLAGCTEAILDGPFTHDAWSGASARVRAERDADCPSCGAAASRRFLGRRRSADAIACGRGAVQVRTAAAQGPDLDALERLLAPRIDLTRNRWLLRFAPEGREVTVFADGRVLVSGTREPAEARALVSRWLGG